MTNQLFELNPDNELIKNYYDKSRKYAKLKLNKEGVEIQIKYRGYIEKEKANADKLNRLESVRIPNDFEYKI